MRRSTATFRPVRSPFWRSASGNAVRRSETAAELRAEQRRERDLAQSDTAFFEEKAAGLKLLAVHISQQTGICTIFAHGGPVLKGRTPIVRVEETGRGGNPNIESVGYVV